MKILITGRYATPLMYIMPKVCDLRVAMGFEGMATQVYNLTDNYKPSYEKLAKHFEAGGEIETTNYAFKKAPKDYKQPTHCYCCGQKLKVSHD